MTNLPTHADVVVIGGGPAGMAASARAAEAGRRVVMIDEGFVPGGQIWRGSVSGKSPSAARRWRARLAATPATVLSSTAVVDVRRSNDNVLTVFANGPEGGFRIDTKTLIIATGARERFLPFPGWTLPNVFGIGAAQALLKTGTNFRGRRVLIAGAGPLMLPVAASMARAGAKLVLVAEQAPTARVMRFAASLWRTPSMLLQGAALRSAFLMTRYATGTWITSVAGDSSVRSATVTDGRTARTIECDVVCSAFGLVPNTELARLIGCAVEAGAVVVRDNQETTVPGVFCAGEPTGVGGVDLSLVEGEIAGAAAAGSSVDSTLQARRRTLRGYAALLEQSFAPRSEVRRLADENTIVCRCEDVRLGDLDRAWTSRQAKLYTRAGMGPCQGRICGAALESIMGWTADAVRPPVQPTRLGAMLGESSPPDRAD